MRIRDNREIYTMGRRYKKPLSVVDRAVIALLKDKVALTPDTITRVLIAMGMKLSNSSCHNTLIKLEEHGLIVWKRKGNVRLK